MRRHNGVRREFPAVAPSRSCCGTARRFTVSLTVIVSLKGDCIVKESIQRVIADSNLHCYGKQGSKFEATPESENEDENTL